MTLALTLLLVFLWCVTHRYLGLGGDARLYAVQALARLHPNLLEDLYLKNTSQDSYTIFSGIFAYFIGLLGLPNAALTLTFTFKAWFFAAAWVLARRLSDTRCAFLTVVLLIITTGEYGAFGVFHYAEDWVTARSMSEALVVTALGTWFFGLRVLGLLITCAAMFVHPLMSLPGLLTIICLWLPLRLSVLSAAAGVALILVTSLVVSWRPLTHVLVVMDAGWLEVVRERSQFLFLQLWRARDWSTNARPFISLAISSLIISDMRVRKLCAASMLVGAAGLAVAVIASLIGPVSLFLQGQAWRWMWVADFASILLLAPTVLALARSARGGLLIALLMLSGWTFSTIIGTACLAGALILWLLRDRIPMPAATMLRHAAILSVAGLLVWGARTLYTATASGFPPWSGEPSALIESAPGLAFLYIVIVALVAHWIRWSRSSITMPLAIGVLFAATGYCLPQAAREGDREGSAEQVAKFSDWRRSMAPTSNVFVEPARNSAAFAWFTLERPSYLTVDQSSGVVFSRATALEVRRRSQVLLPLMEPDWMLLSSMNRTRHGMGNAAQRPSIRLLTADRLIRICGDPQLDFVVSSANVGFEPLRHEATPGNRGEWYLYDCRRVRGPDPSP